MRVTFLLAFAAALLSGISCKSTRAEPARQAAPTSVPGAPAGGSRSAAPAGQSPATAPATRPAGRAASDPAPAGRDYLVVHVFVALCDNRNQGIVPVPAAIGNGQDPKSNLYWGAQYGVRTFFARSTDWKELKLAQANRPGHILDQLLLVSAGAGRKTYLFAQAYDGANMREALTDFLSAAAGGSSLDVAFTDAAARPGEPPGRIGAGGATTLAAAGASDMVAFVGHDGFMDLQLPALPENAGQGNPKCAVVLACKSHDYFLEGLKKAKCRPLVSTTGLMAPEAYTLDAVVRAWAAGQDESVVCRKAAEAYAKYQKCSLKAAGRLFVAGW